MLQECKKAKTSAPIISQSFQSIWVKFDLILGLVGLMNLILIFILSFNIQSRETDVYDFI